jgi:hypothetical protein
MKFYVRFFMIGFILFSFSACASIIKGGGAQAVNFKSEPSDAKLTVTDARSGSVVSQTRTPNTVMLEKSARFFKYGKYTVALEKEGYDKKEVTVEGDASAWYIAGNLVFGGLIGWLIVDPATGAMWSINPEAANVMLNASENDPVCFCKAEFKDPLSVERLCAAFNADKYEVEFLTPDNTISRLNEILEVPDLYYKLNNKDKLPKKAGSVSLPPDMEELKKQTIETIDSRPKFIALSFDQQTKIKKFNRRLLEVAYPNDTPKNK